MRKVIWIVAAAAVSVGALAMSVVGQGGEKAASMSSDDVGPVGRYQIVSIQEVSETSIWLLDSSTGRVWRRHLYPDGDHWMQTICEDYPAATHIKQPGMPPKAPSGK
jgi:hypothetical protein